jgi:hypothetical protein
MSWRTAACNAIEKAISHGRANGLEGLALEKYVRANGYPFGVRENHPYKVWCSAMRAYFPKKKKQTPIVASNVRVNPLTGQLELF